MPNTDTLAPLAARTTPRHDAAARRTARITNTTTEQLAQLADYTETLTRDYIAQGMNIGEALTRATADAVSIAQSLGMIA